MTFEKSYTGGPPTSLEQYVQESGRLLSEGSMLYSHGKHVDEDRRKTV